MADIKVLFKGQYIGNIPEAMNVIFAVINDKLHKDAVHTTFSSLLLLHLKDSDCLIKEHNNLAFQYRAHTFTYNSIKWSLGSNRFYSLKEELRGRCLMKSGALASANERMNEIQSNVPFSLEGQEVIDVQYKNGKTQFKVSKKIQRTNQSFLSCLLHCFSSDYTWIASETFLETLSIKHIID
jgi:hypothetical protein